MTEIYAVIKNLENEVDSLEKMLEHNEILNAFEEVFGVEYENAMRIGIASHMRVIERAKAAVQKVTIAANSLLNDNRLMNALSPEQVKAIYYLKGVSIL